jgi:glucan phosphoethanolaminetransferase (alkaline phosphatase superfamily)
MVIGESSRYDHWSINGYNRNTNPRLSKLDNLISFSNTNTNAYITEYSVPLILTGVNPTSFEENYKRKSILDAFKEAGFKTYWISNQIDHGNISLHRDNADKKILTPQSSKSTINIHQDIELLSKLETVLKEPGDKKFIVLHVQGSHYDYSVRYPDQFDIFKPSNKSIKTLSNDYKSKEIIVNSYDNSIIYSDYILDSIISIVKSKPVLSSVLFISDHGENLFDDDRHLSQHAYPIPSKYIAHIPFMLWYSDAFNKMAPDKIAFLKSNRNKKSTAQNVFYTYTDICGIKIPGIDTSLSLCTQNFMELSRNILGGEFKVYNSDSLK